MVERTFIIAEAGVNHNGSLDTAKKMIDSASSVGADAIKFQSFKAEELVSRYASKAKHQKRGADEDVSQLKMLKGLELDEKAHKEIITHCRKKRIAFISSPFDLDSIDLLHRLNLDIIKIPSGEINNLPYLRKIGGMTKKVLLSTGMADLGEIEDALDILVSSGTSLDSIVVLHCSTDYPTSVSDVNLRAMKTISRAFHVSVGYSDHTMGLEVPIAAVAMGAKVIEKHFTLDRNLPGPDHKASLLPSELADMIAAIRNIEKALGNGIKKPSINEKETKKFVRKSIIAKCSIRKGEVLSEINITVKRPATGISPMRWDEALGTIAARDYKVDELI